MAATSHVDRGNEIGAVNSVRGVPSLTLSPLTEPKPIKISSPISPHRFFRSSINASDSMASCSPHLQKFLLNKICGNYGSSQGSSRSSSGGGGVGVKSGEGRRLCSAIAIDAPASIASVSGIRWGTAQLKGAREEMEDDAVIIQSDDLDGFSFAAVFDGHAGFSSVQFLREELYRECYAALQGKNLLGGKDFKAVKKALEEAFETADAKLLKWLEEREVEDESGATATVLFLRDDTLFVAHVGDSCLALSRSGNAEVLTESHRPYGNKQVSLQEIRRIREAGGWINNGRICGDISVSRAFGDIRFKSKKYEMLRKGVEEGTWTEKFASRIKFTGDLVTATPDVFQAALGSDAEFIVLASDGLWDYMSSSDVVNFIRSQLRKHGDVQLASEALAQVALDRRSADNISIIIADLRRTDWQNVAVQKQNIVLELAQAGATISLVTLGIWMTTLLSS